MNEGFVSKRRGELAIRLAEVERQRAVDVGRELVAGGFLLIDESDEARVDTAATILFAATSPVDTPTGRLGAG